MLFFYPLQFPHRPQRLLIGGCRCLTMAALFLQYTHKDTKERRGRPTGCCGAAAVLLPVHDHVAATLVPLRLPQLAQVRRTGAAWYVTLQGK